MNSIDRVLAILSLFSPARPVLTAEAIAQEFGVSVSQAYRYCRSLVNVGLLDPLSPSGYVLGPAVIELERVLQVSDVVITAARPVMIGLTEHVPPGTTILVSKLYHSRVMCVDQVVGKGVQTALSFERGRPMPLLWGATSKVILAYMAHRDLSRIHKTELADGSPGKPLLAELKAELALIRKQGFCVARGEVDAGRVGIAAPIFDLKRTIVASLTAAIPRGAADDRTVRRIASLVTVSAREVEEVIRDALTQGEPDAFAAAPASPDTD